MSEPGIFDAIYNCRAIRYFTTEPVPDELVTKLLDAAIRAPSGSNRQAWHFVVVTDPATKKTLQEFYKQSFDTYASLMADVPPRPGVSEETQARVVKSAVYLSEHLHEAPVLIVPCLVFEQGRIAGDGAMQDLARKSLYSSIYPAVQNLLLACRAHGLGACLTTLHLMYEEPIAHLLGLPENAETMALIPIGWPNAKFGPVKRVPVGEVTSRNRFGEAW
jgi:F420 biosynthesis protein FbiB-like protein